MKDKDSLSFPHVGRQIAAMTQTGVNSRSLATVDAIAEAQQRERDRGLRIARRFMEFAFEIGDATAFATAREIAAEIEDGNKPNGLTFNRIAERIKESIDVYRAQHRSGT